MKQKFGRRRSSLVESWFHRKIKKNISLQSDDIFQACKKQKLELWKVCVVFDMQCAIASSKHTHTLTYTYSLSGRVRIRQKVADWVR